MDKAVAVDQNKETEEVHSRLGCRHFVVLMLFLGMANAYVMRTNMSVAIVAMVEHPRLPSHADLPAGELSECELIWHANNSQKHKKAIEEAAALETPAAPLQSPHLEGRFPWDSKEQGFVLSAFFYGYVLTQIPFGLMAKRWGSLRFLGYGMLLNSLVGLLVPMAAKMGGKNWLILARFVQGLGEGPIVPCTHALLAKWIPPSERSRMGAAVYAGAQFGTVISLPLSGILCASPLGWPSVFYVFGAVSTVWCLFFLWFVREDPEHDTRLSTYERSMIKRTLGDVSKEKDPSLIPWRSILTSLPFWAILLAHMGHNYGYEMLMTELPSFMRQVLHVDITQNGILSSLPYVAMWIFSIVASCFADWLIYSGNLTLTHTRKIFNCIGQFGPAIAMLGAAYAGCNPAVTVALLTIGVGLNGGIYSGFKVNHLDLSPSLAGVLMSITNCSANLAGLLAPLVAGHVTHNRPTQAAWRTVFFTTCTVYLACGLFYLFASSGKRQEWDTSEDKGQDKDEGSTSNGDTSVAVSLNRTSAPAAV